MNTQVQTLRSTCITTVNVDIEDIRSDLAVADGLVLPRDTYSEFSFGRWYSHVLANSTGDEADDEFRPQTGPAVITSLGQALSGIFGLIESTFYLDRLRWARLIVQADGLLIPHVDFVEFQRPATRLQIPLRTTPAALHSEEETVMHLRAGEVWLLDATVPHAAYSPPGPPRIALCLDFDIPRGDIVSCLRQSAEPVQAPEIMDRPCMTPDQIASLVGLGAILDQTTVREVIRLIGMVHLRRQVHAAACFDWLVSAAERSANEQLVLRARAYRKYCLHERAYRERFVW